MTASTDSRPSAVPTPYAPTALDVGRAGEDLIADLLARSGWSVRDRNWRPAPGPGRPRGELDIVAERGKEGAAAIEQLTGGVGADAVLECVGTDESMRTAFAVARPGATVGFVGVPHGVELPVRRMFANNVGLAGGMAPVRRYLPDLLERVLDGRIDPGAVFDLTLPMHESPEGYRAMDERRAIKVLLQV